MWTKYDGEFKSDAKHGQGSLYFVNGDQFNGKFVEDQVHGVGEYIISKN